MTFTNTLNHLRECQSLGFTREPSQVVVLAARYMIGAETEESIRALAEPQIVMASPYEGGLDHCLHPLLTSEQVDRILQLR